MKAKRFKEEQIIKTIKRAEAGESPKDLCRELGVHQQTFYNWKSKYSGMEVDQLKELKRLQEENNCLKKMVADQALNIEVLKEVNSKKW